MSNSAEYLHQLFKLDGLSIVVVGGTGVLGGALCDGFAAAGAHVVVSGRSAERGEARVAAIREAGGQATFVAVDSSSRESNEELLKAVVSAQGRAYGLVNCAGANDATPYFDVSDEDFRRVMDANLTSTHLASQVFGQHMVEAGGGAILNIGSVSSFLPLSRVFAYSASKAAVLNLTQNLGREFAPQGVRVNCLCPGFFPAEQNRKILDEQRVTNVMRHTPMNRFGEPHELIGAALLLMAPAAGSFMTSATVYVDGGFTAMTI
ncbi:SDR family oxidoreductase [Pirellulales bacterium]|nr:SDR family oxidoreductase [Pirellulales bacterium]